MEITFQNTPLLHFRSFIIRLSQGEDYFTLKNESLAYADPQIEGLYEEMLTQCPISLVADAKYFHQALNITDLYIHLVCNNGLTSVEETIPYLNQLDKEGYLALFKEALLGSSEEDEPFTIALKKQIHEFAEDFQVMKPRLIYFVEKLYTKVYSEKEPAIMSLAAESLSVAHQLYQSDPSSFVAHWIKFMTQPVLDGQIQVIFNLSLFTPLMGAFTYDDQQPTRLFALFGVGNARYFMDNQATGKGEKMIRLLGEETKLKIIKLLAEEPLYTSELAKALGLNRATILHHLSKLIDAGMIVIKENIGTKIYYTLEKEAIKKGLEEFSKSLDRLEKRQ